MNAHAKLEYRLEGRPVDVDGFVEELRGLRRGVDASLGEADLAHVERIQRFGRWMTALGVATAWMGPNPVSILALSLGRSNQWLLMHHVGHRGYDAVPGMPRRLTSKGFAQGKRRFLDWADWMIPEAWVYEHNVLHHSHTGEQKDPDVVERNTEFLRGRTPLALRYVFMGLVAATWRTSYYAPNTLRMFLSRGSRPQLAMDSWTGFKNWGLEFWRRLLLESYLPYAALQFVVLPGLFLPLGLGAALGALVNSAVAEVLTNLHTFLVVGPNHTGEDLYRFTSRPANKSEWLVRQVLGSANFPCGSELVDSAHLYLNYQIEHHLWPDLPMARYRELQPQVKALCEKYGLPYVQEGVFTRFWKMVQVSVGKGQMKVSNGLTAEALSVEPALLSGDGLSEQPTAAVA